MKSKLVKEFLKEEITPADRGFEAARREDYVHEKNFSEEEVLQIIDEVANIFGASLHYHKVKKYLDNLGIRR